MKYLNKIDNIFINIIDRNYILLRYSNNDDNVFNISSKYSNSENDIRIDIIDRNRVLLRCLNSDSDVFVISSKYFYNIALK